LADIGFGVGGACAVVAVVMAVRSAGGPPRSERAQTVVIPAPTASGAGLLVQGRFWSNLAGAEILHSGFFGVTGVHMANFRMTHQRFATTRALSIETEWRLIRSPCANVGQLPTRKMAESAPILDPFLLVQRSWPGA